MRFPAALRRIPVRHAVQGAFLALCAWIGVEFHLFVRSLQGLGPARPHPPGAEAFLPISALLSLKYWILTGRVCELHPAGLFIFLAILAVGLLLRKAFCSWICPVGTLGELLAKPLGAPLKPPRWLDRILRSVKYLLLLFFLWAAMRMDGPMLEGFLYSPFNAAADLKMYFFFVRISALALGVLAVLVLLSLWVRDAWCRYLCPYGALLGLLALAGPLRIKREAATCTDCRRCTRACPARIEVHRAATVRNEACTGCYRCVEACPEKDTLAMGAPGLKRVPLRVFALLMVLLFVAVTGAAMLAGRWQSVLTFEDWRMLIRFAG